MRRTKISAERRSSYKEAARKIIGEDRAARRHGVSQNTIGAIERALVAAFLEGRAQGASVEVEADKLTWNQILPRSRETLSDMTFWFNTRTGHGEDRADRIETFQKDGKQRWSVVNADGKRTERATADGSVRPLVCLGLIESVPDDPNVYGLTEHGLRLCRDYWSRSDRDNPSLPKLSLR